MSYNVLITDALRKHFEDSDQHLHDKFKQGISEYLKGAPKQAKWYALPYFTLKTYFVFP